jgi:UDP-glucose 4-epimerase
VTAGRRVLVTGANGFIGRALVQRCLVAGDVVTAFGHPPRGLRAHALSAASAVTMRTGSILDEAELADAFWAAKPQIVFHLAAISYQHAIARPLDALQTHVAGSYAVLNAAHCAGVASVVLASSAAVYRSTHEPLVEDDVRFLGPIDGFGLSKLLMELAGQYFSVAGLPSCVAARLFNVYGPHEADNRLIPTIVESLRHGDTVTLGNTSTARDYIYLEDAAEMLYRCSTMDASGFTALNLGSGTEHSAVDVVQEVAQALGREARIESDPARVRPVDRPHLLADTRKARLTLGDPPLRPLREGIAALLRAEGVT